MSLIGFFKDLKEKRVRRKAKQLGLLLRNPVTVKDQRTEAIEVLANMPPQLAIPELLKRFEMVTDHGIQDTREKERVLELLMEWEEESKPFIQEAVRTHQRVAWAIKAAEKTLVLNEFLELLVGALNTQDVLFDDTVQERNIEILLALKDYSDPIIVKPAFTLVKNQNENVRIAALECLESQAEHNQEARQLLKDLAAQQTDDTNSRLVGMVQSMLKRHAWAHAE